jgi:hypothetical protein
MTQIYIAQIHIAKPEPLAQNGVNLMHYLQGQTLP